jgi:glycosyltransferase involved in cell wall biosynthesis
MVVHGTYPVGEPRVEREARAAADHGLEVLVVAMRRKGEAARERINDVDVLRLPLTHRRGGGLLRVLGEYLAFTVLATAKLASLGRRYDIVHVHNPPDFQIVAGLIPKAFGARLVFDVHDLSPDMFAMRFEDRPGAGVADAVLRWIERAAAAVADLVVTVHEPYRGELVARGVAESKLIVVMNAVDEAMLPACVVPKRSPDSPFRVLYHGTITPPYGVHLLIEAVAELRHRVPNFCLEIYGEGDEVGLLKQRTAELGLTEQVSISGQYLPHREVLQRVAQASVGVVPNLPTRLNRFALSTKLFEYIALGVPVVSADLPTIRQHFSDTELRFFRAGDAHDLAVALAHVALDPGAAVVRATAAKERYREYRWEVNSKRYLEALQSLLPPRS